MPTAGARNRVVVAGLSPDVRAAGAHVTLVAERMPVLVVRGEDGGLRASGNVCRHRDPLVVAERAGPGMRSTGAFTCPFSGWPGPHEDSGRLRALPVVEAHGVVLVRLSGDGPIEVAESIDAPTARRLDTLGLDALEPADTTRAVADRSWRDVVGDLAADPDASTVAVHAVLARGAGAMELTRVFPLDGDRCVVDRRTYRVRA